MYALKQQAVLWVILLEPVWIWREQRVCVNTVRSLQNEFHIFSTVQLQLAEASASAL